MKSHKEMKIFLFKLKEFRGTSFRNKAILLTRSYSDSRVCIGNLEVKSDYSDDSKILD